jgi:hypothetical protein
MVCYIIGCAVIHLNIYSMGGLYTYAWYSIVMVWYGMVWYGMVWYGMVWYGMVWYGIAWYIMEWCCIWHSIQ